MRFLYFILLLLTSNSLNAQVHDLLQNYCSQRCGTNETCLCQCFFKRGQALRQAEQYSEAIKQFRVSALLCDNRQAQAIIDSILYHEQREWKYEGGANGKFAIANGRGELVEKRQGGNPFRFSNPEPFRKGVAIFLKNDKHYFVDKDGNVLTPFPGYNAIIPTEGNLYYLSIGHQISITSKDGKHPIFWIPNNQNSPFFLNELGPWTSVDQFERFIAVASKYQSIGPHPIEKSYYFYKEGKNWFIEITSPANFLQSESPFFFEGGYVAFVNKGKTGILDKNGRIIVDADRYNSIFIDSGSMTFQVKSDSLWGVIDTLGTSIIPCMYSNIYIQNRLFVVDQNNKTGVLGKDNNIILPIQYDMVMPIWNELFLVRVGEKLGVVNSNNKTLIPIEYDDIQVNEEEKAFFGINNEKIVDSFDSLGNKIVYQETFNENIENNIDSSTNKLFKEYIAFGGKAGDGFIVYEGKKQGLINDKGDVIIPFDYEDITYIEGNFKVAKKLNNKTFNSQPLNTTPQYAKPLLDKTYYGVIDI